MLPKMPNSSKYWRTSGGASMRTNQVKSDLRAGKHVFGTMVFEFFTPGLAGYAFTFG